MPGAIPPPRLTDRQRRALRGLVGLNAALIRRLARELQRDSGLSDADYEVLVNLTNAPGNRQRAFELGATMNWEKSRLSKHLTRMETRGLVAREPCPADSRGAFIVLTEAGRAAFAQAEPLHLEHVRQLLFAALTDEQLDALGDIAAAVFAHLDGIDRDYARLSPHARKIAAPPDSQHRCPSC
jgi:DNA-binding MarR family transcriptional regulator